MAAFLISVTQKRLDKVSCIGREEKQTQYYRLHSSTATESCSLSGLRSWYLGPWACVCLYVFLSIVRLLQVCFVVCSVQIRFIIDVVVLEVDVTEATYHYIRSKAAPR